MTEAASPLALPGPWDLVASGYALEAGAVMEPFAEAAFRLSGAGTSADVLDVATGPGTLALAIAPRVRSVTAIDFAPAMLRELQTRIEGLGVTNVSVHQGDGQALPFAARSFDAGFSMFGLMFFPDRARGFAELFRVLRSSGTAVVSSWAPVEESPLMLAMFGALRAADPSRPAPQTNLLSLENPDVFAAELRQAGFEDVSVTRHVASISVADTTQFWEAMARSSAPIVLLRQRLGEAEWQRQSQNALAYLQSELGSGPIELGTTAFLGFGRRP